MSNPKFLRERIKSIGYALQGVITFLTTQPNSWIQLIAALIVIVSGVILEINHLEWCGIFIAIALVITTEMLNTALEFLTDLVSPSVHPLAKKAKDVAAGAVLIAALTAVIIAALIFLPKLICIR